MAVTATIPPPQRFVAPVLEACPEMAWPHVRALRELIFEMAAQTPGAGTLEETPKWGEPAYLTHRPKTGTTIRLGWDEIGARVRLFVHCQTTLIASWRERYGHVLNCIGNREVSLPTDQPLPRAELQHCIAMALTYHSRKTAT